MTNADIVKLENIKKIGKLLDDYGLTSKSIDEFKQILEAIKNAKDLVHFTDKDIVHIINYATQIRQKYDNNPLRHIAYFDGARHLEKYISSAYYIENQSKDDVEKHFPVSHILLKVIKQNYISLYNLLSYQYDTDQIKNLTASYKKSSDLQKAVKKAANTNKERKSENLAWFINIKNPLIYWKNNKVKQHYSDTINNFKDTTNVDLRRMHVFYDIYFDMNNQFYKKQVQSLFQGLLFEKLIGIKNKVITINNFKNIQSYIYFDKFNNENTNNDTRYKTLFLLDYALFQYPKDINTKSCVDYNLHLLPAEFGLEPPLYNEEEITEHDNKYNHQKVYYLKGPYLFYIFKRNFQSFWNKQKYVYSLDRLIITRIRIIIIKNKDNILLDIKNTDFFENIKRLQKNETENIFINEFLKNDITLDNLQTILKNSFMEENKKKKISDLEKHFIYALFDYLPNFRETIFKTEYKNNLDDGKDTKLEEEIFLLRDIFHRNIDVMSFFDFWYKLIEKEFKINHLIDEDFFFDETKNNNEEMESIYINQLASDNLYEPDLMRKIFIERLKKDLERFSEKVLLRKKGVTKDTEQIFNRMFKEYIIRKS